MPGPGCSPRSCSWPPWRGASRLTTRGLLLHLAVALGQLDQDGNRRDGHPGQDIARAVLAQHSNRLDHGRLAHGDGARGCGLVLPYGHTPSDGVVMISERGLQDAQDGRAEEARKPQE
jgi:hypothetical protein